MNRVSVNSGTTLNATTSILLGCQKEKRERRGQKKTLEEIIAKNFLKWERNHSLKSRKQNEYNIK